MNIKEGINECSEELGIYLDEEVENLQDYLESSLGVMTFLVSIEEKFNIRIPALWFKHKEQFSYTELYQMISICLSKDK